MTPIDCSDCSLTVQIGRRTKISLYNHLRAFLLDEIGARGLDARDPLLFNMLTIETHAIEMAEKVVDEVVESMEQGQMFFEDVDLTSSVASIVEETLAEEKK